MRRLDKLTRSALGASAALALALMAGRITGLIREIVLANRFGVSAEADTAIILLTIPDLLVNLLLSGGLSAALVPRFRGLSTADAARLFWEICVCVALVCFVVTILIAFWPAAIFGLFAPGATDSVKLAGHPTLVFVALSVPFAALSGVSGALLASRERYFAAGLGTLILNSTVIAALTFGGMAQGLVLLGLAVLVGTGLRLASQLLVLPADVWKLTGKSCQIDKPLLNSFAAGVTASALAVAPAPIIRAAASLLGSGNIATFNYAQKLVELPLGVLITTIGTVSLSRLSGHFAAGKLELARSTLWTDLRLALTLGILVAVFGISLAEPLVTLIFLRGAISSEQLGEILSLTRIVLLSVPFAAVSTLAAAALNAQLRPAEVMRATALSLIALNVLAAPGLILASETVLMSAVVGWQAVLACLLAMRADICIWGADGVLNRQFLRSITITMSLAVTCIAIILSWGQEDAFILLGLSIFGFGISVVSFLILAKD